MVSIRERYREYSLMRNQVRLTNLLGVLKYSHGSIMTGPYEPGSLVAFGVMRSCSAHACSRYRVFGIYIAQRVKVLYSYVYWYTLLDRIPTSERSSHSSSYLQIVGTKLGLYVFNLEHLFCCGWWW